MKQNLDMIHRLLDGEIAEPEKMALLNKVNSDPVLKKEFDVLHRVVSLTEDSARISAPPYFTSRVMRKLPEPKRSFKASIQEFFFKGRTLRWNMAAALTAVSFLLVVLGGTLQLSKQHNMISSTNIPPDSGVTVWLTFYAPKAKEVAIAGDFNKWKIDNKILRKQSNGNWVAEMHLKPGVYNYMFVVDGKKWKADPNAELYHDDGFGNKNSVLRIAQL